MRNPVTFRPTLQDNRALDLIAQDFPEDAGSVVRLIRRALAGYVKHVGIEECMEALERRISALESRTAN